MMTHKDKLTIQRMLGVIEGAAVCASREISQLIGDAVATIDEILDKDGDGGG